MKKLTRAQRKQLVADYVTERSYRKVAEKYGISHVAAAKIVQQEKELYNELTLIENDIIINAIKEKSEAWADLASSVVDLCLLNLANPMKLKDAEPQHLARVLSVIIDKFIDKSSGTNIENAGVVILPAQAKVEIEE